MMSHPAAPVYDVFTELARLEGLASGAFCRWPRSTWRSRVRAIPLFVARAVQQACASGRRVRSGKTDG